MEKTRCFWVGEDPLMQKYHDEEWGTPEHNDRKLFEYLLLDNAQAGLSWKTILHRREGYRKAFDNFDPIKIALYSEEKQAALMQDPGIIRNKLKIKSAVQNAQAFLKIQEEFGSFDAYIWSFVSGKPVIGRPEKKEHYRATSPESDAMSKDLKKR